MMLDPRKMLRSFLTVFMFAIVFLVGSVILQLTGIWGIIFAFGLPIFGSDPVMWFYDIVLWIVKTIIKLFALGMYLSICSYLSSYFMQKVKI